MCLTACHHYSVLDSKQNILMIVLRVSLGVHISGMTCPNFTKFSTCVTRGTVFFWRRYDCTSVFADDVTFSYIKVDDLIHLMDMSLPHATSLQSHAHANAPATWYWLRPVRDTNTHRGRWLSLRCTVAMIVSNHSTALQQHRISGY